MRIHARAPAREFTDRARPLRQAVVGDAALDAGWGCAHPGTSSFEVGPRRSDLLDADWLKRASLHLQVRGYKGHFGVSLMELRGPDGQVAQGLFKGVGLEEKNAPWNEVAASNLNDALGRGKGPLDAGEIVPLTVWRTFEGVRGSLQLFLKNTPDASAFVMQDIVVARRHAERARIVEYGLANSDRKGDNTGLKKTAGGRYLVKLWDNSLAFDWRAAKWTLDGNAFWGFPWADRKELPVLPETRRFAREMDLARVAQGFAEAELAPDKATLALRRLMRVKVDPSVAAIGGPDIGVYIREPEQRLTEDQLAEVDRLIAAAFKI